MTAPLLTTHHQTGPTASAQAASGPAHGAPPHSLRAHRRAPLPATLATVAGALAAGVLAVAAPSAWAQAQSATASAAQEGQGSASSSSSQWGLGVGVGVTERAYLGADRKVSGLPLIFYENTWVRVAGTTVEAKLLNHAFTSNQRVTGGLLLKYVGDGYKASDSSALAGMAERKGGLMGGAGLTWHNPIAKLSMEWTTDLSDHSKGQRLQVQADRRFQFGVASITPRLGAQWMDRKWVDYYYGVRASEATVNRAAYQADAGVALEAGVRVDYAIQKQHVIFLDLGVTHLPKEATNSPIVDRSNLPRAAVGYLYRF